MSNESQGQKSQFSQTEEELVTLWQKEKTFEKSLEQRKDAQRYEFYDGPPFANGLPHYGHLVSSIVKDAIPRYKTMQGLYVPRRFGWDCHGLPAEMKAEQDLGLGSKAEIETYGVEKFINYCRNSVLEFTQEWESYIHRIGRWVDFKDNYYTMDQPYMESVIWAFKQLYDKGLVVRGFKVVPYCYICETSLSNFESRQDDAYRERTDPAVTVRFPLPSGENLLAWTTTPWTLPANLAIAVNKEIDYVVMEGNGERVILSKTAVERYADQLAGYSKVRELKGTELVGQSYEPPFHYFDGHKNAFQILHADFVTDEDGTGIAHEAPGFGEEDQKLCEAHGIEVVVPVDKTGRYTSTLHDLTGLLVFDANAEIIDRLQNSGRLFKKEEYTHSYPHCWRTDNPLIYRAVDSWIIKVTELKQQLLDKNQEINWIPANVKDGAFGNWLEGVRDWNVSRDRYWGAPIPVWQTDDGELTVIGSMEELRQKAVDPSLVTNLHKPAIDKVQIKTGSGKIAKRVPEVFDCWFESGSMPYAQHGYPFGGKDKFIHPADFIVEYIGQTRGWFYTLHVLATALWDEPAFKNVISHGVINGNDGRKLSKRLGNYPDLQMVLDTYGADATRLYLFGSPVINGETIQIDEVAMRDVSRNVLGTLNNSFSFFNTYAKVDGWSLDPARVKQGKLERPQSDNLLDQWLLARLDETITEVTAQADSYDIPRAVRPIRPFIDDLSNWYIRRSRRRFWKSENDSDKEQAYATLHYTLLTLCQLLAPWAPFISDHLWRQLVSGTDLPESVHLSDWPSVNKPDKASQRVLEEMTKVREIITEGLAYRAEAKVKVRQPLASVTVPEVSEGFNQIIAEELNVKEVKQGRELRLDTDVTPELKAEGIARDLVRFVQNARKNAGFNVDDRIKLKISSDNDEITGAVKAHKNMIFEETLATDELEGEGSHSETVKLDGQEIQITVKKRPA